MYSTDVSHHARVVIAYLLAEPDYHDQPEPVVGDTASLLQDLLGEVATSFRDIARAMAFIWRDDVNASFSTVRTSDGCILLVSGNVRGGELRGKTLFQPFVIRPKRFSAPWVLTANSLVLESESLQDWTFRCVGGVRGLGMISESAQDGERQLRIV